MKRLIILTAVALTLELALLSNLAAQEPAAPSSTPNAPAASSAAGETEPAAQAPARPAPSPTEIQSIIAQFAAKEAEFKKARDNYTYHQSIKVQELDEDGQPLDRQHIVESDIVFTPRGTRTEKVTFAPLSTLRRISLSPEDERDFRSLVAFVLTTEELPLYNVRYQGRQKVDELDTYVFRVGPKVIEKGERYFDGIVWVDDRDLQIVKSYGKTVPEVLSGPNQNRTPRYETYREQIDGKYWFPTWTGADESIPFPSGAVRIRIVVKYDNYKQFKSDVNITYGEEAPAKP